LPCSQKIVRQLIGRSSIALRIPYSIETRPAPSVARILFFDVQSLANFRDDKNGPPGRADRFVLSDYSGPAPGQARV